MRRLAAVACATLLLGLGIVLPATAAPVSSPIRNVPVFAYYYQWFTPGSWDRAKVDYPLAGRYSSDDVSIMTAHVAAAKAAGIDGFIVSWKSSATNDQRLESLIKVARAADFKLALIYQGLDFDREPLPVERVAADFDLFAQRYASDPVFDVRGRSLMIWSGTWRFSAADIERVTAPLRRSALVLATEKSPDDYRRVAGNFDGNAYYWSSVDPESNAGYPARLAAMAAAVHDTGGLWIAPFAPGFNAQLVGGARDVPRRDGATLRDEYNAAVSSSPDLLGLISWNEFSENTHVEPSQRYGNAALTTLTSLLSAPPVRVSRLAEDSSAQGRGGPMTVQAGLAVLLLLAVAVTAYRFLQQPRPERGQLGRARGRNSRPQGWRPPRRRVVIAIVVVVALAAVLTPVILRAGAVSDVGSSPLYLGAQPVRNGQSVVLAAAGDISCPVKAKRHNKEFDRANACRMADTTALLGTIKPDAVLALGDLQYESGSLADFRSAYANTWGAFDAITYPVPGNHEYGTPHAKGYFDYFGARAGEPDKGYYSYDLGAWHVVALNSECRHVGGCDAMEPQAAWLRQDLADHPRACVLAYWHRPRFSSGSHGNNLDMDPLWRILSDAHADLVLSGHDHDYERFVPMDAGGNAAAGDGLAQLVVGTGGASHYQFHLPEATSVARITGQNGVLRLELEPQGYGWQFLQSPNGQLLDSGTATCSPAKGR